MYKYIDLCMFSLFSYNMLLIIVVNIIYIIIIIVITCVSVFFCCGLLKRVGFIATYAWLFESNDLCAFFQLNVDVCRLLIEGDSDGGGDDDDQCLLKKTPVVDSSAPAAWLVLTAGEEDVKFYFLVQKEDKSKTEEWFEAGQLQEMQFETKRMNSFLDFTQPQMVKLQQRVIVWYIFYYLSKMTTSQRSVKFSSLYRSVPCSADDTVLQ